MAGVEMDTSGVPDYRALLDMSGRTFVVLGGGNGIGRQACHALAQVGAHVVCVDQDEVRAEAVAAEVAGTAVVADVTSRGAVEGIFRDAGAVRGVVDIVGMPHLGPLSEIDDERWRSQFDLVLTHAFLALQVGGKALADAGGGAMVFVGSIAGIVHVADQAAYGAAKAALHQLVGSMARELAPAGVRVNAVAPGFTRTPRLLARLTEEQWQRMDSMVPRRTSGTPAEVAAVILFLASDLASYVTGQVLPVDGGLAGTLEVPGLSSR